PEQKGLPRDIPLDRIEVLRYDIKGVKVRKRKMRTKTELTLEQTQQGVSDEVLVIMATHGRKKAITEPAPPARDLRDVETIERLQQQIQLSTRCTYFSLHDDD
ncbi:hypothetical protein Tco_0998479, partial [Tanacetum coccineum]